MALARAVVAPFLAVGTFAAAFFAPAVTAEPGGVAYAQEPGAAGDAAATGSTESSITPVPAPQWGPTYHHAGQVGFSLMLGTGYRMIVPYKENVYCGDEEQAGSRVCTARSPTFADLELSYGLTPRLDLLLAARFGIEKDFIGARQFAVMPGLRIWLDQDEALKFYTTLQLVYDNTDHRKSVSAVDYGGRVALGFMYDPIPNVGFFTQLGATFGVKRWFRIEADLGLGVQVRFP